MRKIYQKYFKLPEANQGNMSEHVFFARLTVAIVCIVLCMSAMGFSAYAFFTASVSSNMNQIQAASFDLEVTPIETLTTTSSASYESEKTYKLQPGDYVFVLKKSGNATTGYCQIVLTPNDVTSKETNESVFYTRQLGKVEGQNEPINERQISITVGVETTVKFVPCWGTYSSEGVSEVKYAMGVKKTTTSTGNTSPTETTNTPESTVTPTEEKQEEVASTVTESDTAKSNESTEDTTTSTDLIE